MNEREEQFSSTRAVAPLLKDLAGKPIGSLSVVRIPADLPGQRSGRLLGVVAVPVPYHPLYYSVIDIGYTFGFKKGPQ